METEKKEIVLNILAEIYKANQKDPSIHVFNKISQLSDELGLDPWEIKERSENIAAETQAPVINPDLLF